MSKRYVITVHWEDDGYEIEHEADILLVEIASDLNHGDPQAKEQWEPFSQLWPELMDIEENEDGSDDFPQLSYLDGDPDAWPGRRAFWYDAMHSGIPDIGPLLGGGPTVGNLYRIRTDDALKALKVACADQYDFVEGDWS